MFIIPTYMSFAPPTSKSTSDVYDDGDIGLVVMHVGSTNFTTAYFGRILPLPPHP